MMRLTLLLSLFLGRKIGENISENDFVKVLTKKVQGTMNLTSSDRSDAYEAAGPFQRVNIYMYCNPSKCLDTLNTLCNHPKI